MNRINSASNSDLVTSNILNSQLNVEFKNKSANLPRKIATSIVIGITAISGLVAGGDYLAVRFGTEAGNAAFASINNQAQDAIKNLENDAPGIIAIKVLPSAVCFFAALHKISPSVLKSDKLNCSNYSIDKKK